MLLPLVLGGLGSFSASWHLFFFSRGQAFAVAALVAGVVVDNPGVGREGTLEVAGARRE